MDRLLKGAFFPLIVIILLAWLVSQAEIKSSPKQQLTYGGLIGQVEAKPSQYVGSAFVFNPSKRSITLKDASGKTTETVHYPSDQSALQFQDLLQKKHLPSTRRASAASRGWLSLAPSCRSCC